MVEYTGLLTRKTTLTSIFISKQYVLPVLEDYAQEQASNLKHLLKTQHIFPNSSSGL